MFGKSNKGVNNPYARQGAAPQGTVVPGMMGMDHAETNGVSQGFSQAVDASRKDPVVGFAYTISHGGLTEFWPLYLGKNTIGRNEENDIVLAEGSVSGEHAAINIKKLKSGNGLYAVVRDEGSKTGIFVNDDEVLSELPISNNDIVTIGDNYRLLIFLIDTNAYGLEAAPNFIEVEMQAAPPRPNNGGFDPYDPSGRSAGGTETIGPGGNVAAGGTEFL